MTEQQKELPKEISEDMLDLANHDPEFIKTIVSSDETWVMVTTQKPSFNPHYGNTRNHSDQKKLCKFAAM